MQKYQPLGSIVDTDCNSQGTWRRKEEATTCADSPHSFFSSHDDYMCCQPSFFCFCSSLTAAEPDSMRPVSYSLVQLSCSAKLLELTGRATYSEMFATIHATDGLHHSSKKNAWITWSAPFLVQSLTLWLLNIRTVHWAIGAVSVVVFVQAR